MAFEVVSDQTENFNTRSVGWINLSGVQRYVGGSVQLSVGFVYMYID